MKTNFLILCFLGMVGLTACTKSSGPSSVSGQVVDQITGKGVPYAQVTVIGQNSNVVGAGGQQGGANTTADANGNFSMNFDATAGNSYEVNATAKNYLSGQANSYTDISAGKNTNVKVYIEAEGFVRFNLVNIQPMDTIWEFVLDDFGNNAPSFQLLHKDTSFIVYGIGNTFTHFTYKINKYGLANGFITYNDTIYIKALDTVSYIIKY